MARAQPARFARDLLQRSSSHPFRRTRASHALAALVLLVLLVPPGAKGAAVYVTSGTLSISNSLFIGNNAQLGAAVYVAPGAALTSLSSCIFDMNGARCVRLRLH